MRVKKAFGLCIAAVFVLALGTTAYAGPASETEGQAMITAGKEQQKGAYQLTVMGRNRMQDVITDAEIGYLPENGTFDEGLLEARIQQLLVTAGNDIPTSDAHVSSYQKGQPFTVIPEAAGTTLDSEKVKAAIKTAAAAGLTEVNLDSWGCYVPVTRTKKDPQLNRLCDVLNAYRQMSITYAITENGTILASEQLDGETICSWLTGIETGQVSVVPEMAAAYVAALAEKYDTAGKERLFTTAYGTQTALTGPYGWKIDQAAETAALLQMIYSGQSQTREPVYSGTAASRVQPDWGTTYVEIDLNAQHVFMFANGEMVWEAPCVTGNVAKNHTTPEGIYGLTYKQKNRVLRGRKLSDGSYEYESPVSYWMPFNGGIGLHDANWRGAFGGEIYKTNGSHGCINLPVDKAGILYELVYPGIPVICYN